MNTALRSFIMEAGTPPSAEEQAQLERLTARKVDLSDLPASPAAANWLRHVPQQVRTSNEWCCAWTWLDYFKRSGRSINR